MSPDEETLRKLGRRQPGEAVFRHRWLIENETKVTVALLVLIAVDIAVVCVFLQRATSDGDQVSVRLVAWLVALAVGVPVGIAAVLGAQTVHRHGWFVALFLTAGFIVGPVGAAAGDRRLLAAGVALCVLGVVGFWVLGWIRGVPK